MPRSTWTPPVASIEYTLEVYSMRTNVVLDDELVAEAMALSGERTKRAVIELALRELVQRRRRRSLFDLSGKIELTDDFDHKALRETRG